jgi:hypothetical protein
VPAHKVWLLVKFGVATGDAFIFNGGVHIPTNATVNVTISPCDNPDTMCEVGENWLPYTIGPLLIWYE